MVTTSPAIRDLYKEHNAIMVLLEILDAVSAKIKRGEAVKKADLEKMVEFIAVFADKCHHGKEEFILIPALRMNKYANSVLVESIVGEHKSGRDMVGGMRDALKTYRAGNPESYHFAVNADAYIAMILVHIRKENVLLFPDSEKVIGEKEMDRIMKRFDHVEETVVGRGRHEEYHALLDAWKESYLLVKNRVRHPGIPDAV